MLLPARIVQGVRDGSVTLAFRRWEEPRVKQGGTQLTGAGIISFRSVEEVLAPADLTEADARAAGFPDLVALRRQLWPPALQEPVEGPGPDSTPGGDRPKHGDPPRAARRGPRASKGGAHVYRVGLAWVGDDPRVTLREEVPDAAGLADVTAAVAKLDAGRRTGPWTRPVLEWIRDHPGVISTELAGLLGREVPPVKSDIRRLKALGLTESLRVGYRLSPRGRAHLESLG